MKNLNNLLDLLLTNHVEFVLVGGFASVLYGSSITTRDLDICMLLTPDSIEKLRKILKQYDPKHRINPKKISFLTFPEKSDEIKNLYLETKIGTLDIISQITGVGDFERIKEKAVKIEIFGKQCLVMSIDDLIKSKKTIGREKDKLVINELLAIKDKLKK